MAGDPLDGPSIFVVIGTQGAAESAKARVRCNRSVHSCSFECNRPYRHVIKPDLRGACAAVRGSSRRFTCLASGLAARD